MTLVPRKNDLRQADKAIFLGVNQSWNKQIVTKWLCRPTLRLLLFKGFLPDSHVLCWCCGVREHSKSGFGGLEVLYQNRTCILNRTEWRHLKLRHIVGPSHGYLPLHWFINHPLSSLPSMQLHSQLWSRNLNLILVKTSSTVYALFV